MSKEPDNMRFQKRKIPQINASSMADIAFLLLIFFLITSSFDSMTGIYRKMNPALTEKVIIKKRDVEGRNLLSIRIDENNQIKYEEQTLTFSELKNICKTFIDNPNDWDVLPQKESVELPEIGNCRISSLHNISLEISRKAKYQTYLSALNEMMAAYNELRNEAALAIFQQPFNRLTDKQQAAVREIYPQHISEKEPKTTEEGGAI